MTFDEIMSNIETNKSREESKEVIRKMKSDGITKGEIEALYLGIGMSNEKFKTLIPLMYLWIEEVYEEQKDESL